MKNRRSDRITKTVYPLLFGKSYFKGTEYFPVQKVKKNFAVLRADFPRSFLSKFRIKYFFASISITGFENSLERDGTKNRSN